MRKAIELDPKDTHAHFILGNALKRKGKVEEAIESYKKAIALDPKFADAHNSLGFALDQVGRQKEAIEAWREAVRLKPRLVGTHYWLGKALLLQGRPAEAVEAFSALARLIPAQKAREVGLAAELATAKRLAALDKRMPALLEGKDRFTDNKGRLEVADLCRRQGRFAAAVRFSTEAFAAEPKLADNLKARHRYNAACSAALAAAAKGPNSGKLDDKQRARLRKQALDWLEADLAGWTKLLDSGPPQARPFIVQALTHWQKDADLAGIRDKAALAKLPAQEQKAFTQLWADVAALLKKAQEKSK